MFNKYGIYLLLFLAGLGDLASSLYMESTGYMETRAFAIPFLATTVFCAFFWLTKRNFFNSVPMPIRKLIIFGLVYFSFIPLLWNSLLVVGFGTT